jgi:hypothetical protein
MGNVIFPVFFPVSSEFWQRRVSLEVASFCLERLELPYRPKWASRFPYPEGRESAIPFLRRRAPLLRRDTAHRLSPCHFAEEIDALYAPVRELCAIALTALVEADLCLRTRTDKRKAQEHNFTKRTQLNHIKSETYLCYGVHKLGE